MKTVFQKLQFKGQNPILILHHPEEFNQHLINLADIKIDTDLDDQQYNFVLIFVMDEDQIKTAIQQIHPHLKEDATLWFAYPKKSSKKYQVKISRNIGWKSLGNFDYEVVSQIAIDEDWSALRFRKATLIKSLKRNPKMALSKEGKNRTAQN
ncbi:MAG: hypothetical protein Q8J84_10135 [Flavobacteriaceae bacterium]|nr:hypothetical protein [Flavobacteriaceae bacterium]